MSRWIVAFAVALCCARYLPAEESSPLAARRPNIVLVMPDDVGYGDYSFLGNPVIQTPNIDAFCQQGLRFADFQVSPTCAPTRAALMTGRHEFKNGVTHTINERERLTLEATTLAQVLQHAGYTTGIFGKWHLGDEHDYRPEQRGFDEVYIHGAGGIGQSYPGSCGDAPGNTNINPTLWHNGKFEKTKGYCTDLFFEQAIFWIDGCRQQDKPFFAYITPNAAHTPHVLPEEYYRHLLPKVEGHVRAEELAKFLGMIENVDANFGKLLDRLAQWNLTDNTLVIYIASDNGGTEGVRLFNAGLRGMKVQPWQGGTRTWSCWRWPNGFQGGLECNRLTAHIDVFPTIAEIVGAEMMGELKAQIEGRSLVPLLVDPRTDWAERFLVTHVGRWKNGTPPEQSKYKACAIRNTRYSLVNNEELYDLINDPGQSQNILAAQPRITRLLRAEYEQWWKEVQPLLVNENAYLAAPKINPFHELYYQQFGRAD